MKILKTEVAAEVGGTLTFERIDGGMACTQAGKTIATIWHDHSRETKYAAAKLVCATIYGRDRRGEPAATNSMVHDVLQMIEQHIG
jgi:hypothetical protein